VLCADVPHVQKGVGTGASPRYNARPRSPRSVSYVVGSQITPALMRMIEKARRMGREDRMRYVSDRRLSCRTPSP
jgi:hypothetical protein